VIAKVLETTGSSAPATIRGRLRWSSRCRDHFAGQGDFREARFGIGDCGAEEDLAVARSFVEVDRCDVEVIRVVELNTDSAVR